MRSQQCCEREPGGGTHMIRRCEEREFDVIWEIVNDGARAYEGAIPADRWTEPYMSREKLKKEIEDGVVFWGYEEGTAAAGGMSIAGVMGIQEVKNVTLVRHA